RNKVRTRDKLYKTLHIPLHQGRQKSEPTRARAISVSFFFHSLRKPLSSPHHQQCSFSYTEYTDYEQPLRACLYRNSTRASPKRASPRRSYTTPWSSIASATFANPAMFAPTTRLPRCPYSAAVSQAFSWIVAMMWRKRKSTSPRGHGSRIEFWLISSPDVATPPALAALPG